MITTFLIGAGFNIDANNLVSPYQATSLFGEKHNINAVYPVISELAKIVFPNETIIDFEERLSKAIAEQNFCPMKHIVEVLTAADHYVGNRLDESDILNKNIYDNFLDWCGPTSFLTFNYDALLELRLFKSGRWFPHDGFGVPVQVRTLPDASAMLNNRSTHKILHLHGSYLLYTEEFNLSQPDANNTQWLSPAKPKFLFDPDTLGSDFTPYEGILSNGFLPPEFRVIAPVPDKAKGLKEAFIKECRREALCRVKQSQHLIAIGYGFADCDKVSFAPILEKFIQTKGRLITVIDPRAKQIVEYLQTLFPAQYRPIPCRFCDWVRCGFPEDAINIIRSKG